MIIVFHALYFVVRYLHKVYKKAKEIKAGCHLIGSEVIFQNRITVDDSFNVKFDPPLFKQRYATVQQILLNEKYRPRIKKIVDFGCSELKFFIYLKHLFGINEILCVDSDEDVLREHRYAIHPLNVDYLKKRSEKLSVQLLCGSVADPDSRLKGSDAVVAIELIEHLYPDALDALPFNIFGYIRPLIVIFTTPNVEFNVIFNRSGFRHFDHKFEWDRSQFQDWCKNITKRFPTYHVYFDGIGDPPKELKHVGHCTQYAVFLRDNLSSISVDEITPPAEPFVISKESYGVCTYYSYTKQILNYDNQVPHHNGVYYKVIDSIDYPFEIDNRTPEQRILDEVLYKIYSACTPRSRFYNEDTDRIEMPLYMLISNEEGCYTTASEVRTLLENQNFRVEECQETGRDEKTLCVVYELDTMNNRNSSPDDVDSNDEQQVKIPWTMTAADDSDWDAEYTHSVKINDEKVEEKEKEEKVNQEKINQDKINQDKINQEKNNQENEKDKEKSKPRKGTNIKNRHQPSTSKSSNKESKVKVSSQNSSQESALNKKSAFKTSAKSKLITTKTKIEDSAPSTSDAKKKRKKSDDENLKSDDIKSMFDCFVYNTLNTIEVAEDYITDETLPHTSTYSDIKQLMELEAANQEMIAIENNAVAQEVIEDVLGSVNVNVSKPENPTVNISREALFDPNSETDMLEEFAIPDGNENQPNVILIGVNINNEEEGVENEQFPNWLLQLLGANVEEVGESHDEPHFYCQGDGIGVHPSIIEVDLDEEESTSDSSSSNDQAEAERTISESTAGPLPNDESESTEPMETTSRPVLSAIPGSTTESDEFFDTVEENALNSDQSKRT